MLPFLGFVINMVVPNLHYIKNYGSQEFVFRVPFFDEVFTMKCFLKIFWMLHLETVSTADSLRTRIQKVSNPLKYINARYTDYFIPGQNLSVDESVVGFKGKLSFFTYNQNNQLNGESHSASSCVCMFIPYHEKITPESLVKLDLPFTSWIVLQLFHNIRKTWPGVTEYHTFTDQFYTSPTLVSGLS